jgi:hypothetical protein
MGILTGGKPQFKERNAAGKYILRGTGPHFGLAMALNKREKSEKCVKRQSPRKTPLLSDPNPVDDN